jgi:hypothetical protein
VVNLLVDRVRTRILPALITAFGVTLLTAGLLTYTGPVEAGPLPVETPTSVAIDPTASPAASPLITLPPLGTPLPTAEPTAEPTPVPTASPLTVEPSAARRATRVRVAALDIDLPVIRPSGGANTYPVCDVAMYIQELGQPGGGRVTYLYAHARTGMFLPILDASKVQNGRKMLGMVVEVYTNDDLRFLYEVYEVRRHVTTLDSAVATSEEEVWLQTSEGPRGTPGKTQILARFLSVERADHAEANPKPKPVVCG